jgi:cytochrome oxidase Cu insertion factor (SCO1/SenC/PrrC family)
MRILAFSIVLGWAGLASAELLPPARAGGVPRNLAVLDEENQRRDLPAMGAPALLLPIFTRCSGSCPVTAVLLKEALASAHTHFRVVVISFDAQDTAEDMKSFRQRLGLPSTWLLVRSADDAASRTFLDDLDFHLRISERGFDHPNETFVLSSRGVWAATFVGASFPEAELETALKRAIAADDPAVAQKLGAWLIRPEAWISLACAGVGASCLVLLLFGRSSNRRRLPSPRGSA